MIDGGSPYAGVVSRSMAFVVDAFVVAALAIGSVLFIEVVTWAAGVSLPGLAGLPTAALICGPPILLVAYNTALWALSGRTPGMALFGLRVVRSHGGPLTWGHAAVRALVLGFVVVGALWCLVDSRRQCLHDKAAGTLVVYDPPRLPLSPATGEAAGRPGVTASP